MNNTKTDESLIEDRRVEVSQADLQAAWSVLENLVVSFDQIGGFFGEAIKFPEKDDQNTMLEVLRSYLSPDLVQSIGAARTGLARYISDEEAEALTESIPYWDYAGTKP